MAYYAAEENVWKCPKHPSKRRTTGVCPTCLRERLGTLCADCGNVRPCSCWATATATTSSPSSSSSSSFSIFSSSSSTAATVSAAARDGVGVVGRLGNLIESEPAFPRSRSVGIPFLLSRFASAEKENLSKNCTPGGKAKMSSFWSVFKSYKSKKCEDSNENENKNNNDARIHDFERMMMRSRSVSAAMTSARCGGDLKLFPAKDKGWHFPSPMKVFRQKSLSKSVQDRSYRV